MPKKSDKEKKRSNKGNDSDDSSSPKPSTSTTKDERRPMFQEGASGSGEGHESRSDKKAKGDDRKTDTRKRSSRSLTASTDAHQSSHLPNTGHLGEPESCASPSKRNRFKDVLAGLKDAVRVSPKKASSKGSKPSSSTTASTKSKDGLQSTSSSDPSVAEYFRSAESEKSAPDQGAEVDLTSPSGERCLPNWFKSCLPSHFASDPEGSSELPCPPQSNPKTATKGKYQTLNQAKLEGSSSSCSPLSKKSSNTSSEMSLPSSSNSDPIASESSRPASKSSSKSQKTGSSSTSKDHDPLEGKSGMHLVPPESDRELRCSGAKRTPRIDQGNEDPNRQVPRSSSRSKSRSPSPRPKCNCRVKDSKECVHEWGCSLRAYNQRSIVQKSYKKSVSPKSPRNESTEVAAERRKNKKTGEKSGSDLSSTEE